MLQIEKNIMAHRYLYYVKNQPVISDYEYDMLEKEAIKNVGSDSPIKSPGSDLESSYSNEVKALASAFYSKRR